MLPLIVAAGFLGLAAYAAWQLMKQMRKSQVPGPPGGSGSDKLPPQEKVASQARTERDDLIQRIVDSVRFATTQMEIGRIVIGTEERVSDFPADDIRVRPIRTIAEAPKALPATQALDDDVYFSLLASKSLPVVENIERVELTEPQFGPSRKVLLVLQDISSSMNEFDRIGWAIRLNQKLVDRCLEQKAEYILITFSNTPEEVFQAKTPEECRRLRNNLSYVLRADGGTDIDRVLRAGMDVLEENKFGEAKILLITDGTEPIHVDLTRERLKSLNVHLHTVCIAGDRQDLREVSQQYDVLWDFQT